MIKNPFPKIVCIFLLIAYTSSDMSAFSYEHFSHGRFTSIHVLTVNPKEHIVIPVKALGKIRRETVVNLANRHRATAAINGGFWKLNGNPAGALKINHQWFGTPIKPRGAIGWSVITRKVLIDRVLTNYSLTECSSESQIEVVPVSIPPYTTAEEWSELEHIVGGTPVLVRSGNAIKDFSPEQTLKSFLVKRYPRTAIGIKGNGDWVFVVVDSLFYGLLGGMTIKELSQLMVNLDCIEALNLDGGGSSTMVIEGKVINTPCGKIKEGKKRVEAVSDAILIF